MINSWEHLNVLKEYNYEQLKDLIRELGEFDENLDIEVHKVYRTGRIDKFTIEKIVPCIRKENKETVRAIVRIK